jgi:bla regulator protein blaR1
VNTHESISEAFTLSKLVRQRLKLLTTALLGLAVSLPGMGSLRAQSDAVSNAAPAKPGTTAPTSDSSLPKFEVATIKPTKADEGRTMMMFTPDGISIQGVPMKMLVREAFGVEDDRILNEPAWLKNRYDIEAKVDAVDAPKLKDMKIDQRRQMILPLLEDRFNMKYHHETRELPMYALVVAKGGLKMKPSPPDDPSKADDPQKPEAGDAKDKPRMGRRSLMMNGRGHLESTGTGIPFLVHVLSSQLGRTVVDKTGLTGNYDYTLQWTPDDMGTPMAGDAGPGKGDISPDAGGPTLFTALEEQLGLKLESQKGTVDVIVIDHIDAPSEN